MDGNSDELVQALIGLSQRVHQVLLSVATRHSLTPQQLALVRMLDKPVSMGAFAEGLACDPSNVTGLVDRVERLGLVERTSDHRDRRVRHLSLTPKGKAVRQRLNDDLAIELAAALGLGEQDRSRLVEIAAALSELPPSIAGEVCGSDWRA